MAFTPTQVRKLVGKLPEQFVKNRSERGMTLSYVEGWHVIDEANRVFGFDGWDRETVSAECVWQDARISPKACSYAVRIRIKVRAGKTIISREGTGLGRGTGATLGEAHESALKEAETDATKRALTTFGNLFGLALYDKEQAGVQRMKPARPESSTAPVTWTVMTAGAPPRICETPQQFCSAAKEALRQTQSITELEALWTGNAPVIAQLRAIRPELRTRSGVHYTEVLESLYKQQRERLEQEARDPRASEPPVTDGIEPGVVITKWVRDPAHLKYVASLPCLVCGRMPCHAHHLRFIQPRSLGSKPSDEWTVPLCPIHHRALHDAGREAEWWLAKGIDAKAEAERLWQTKHAPTSIGMPPITGQQPRSEESSLGRDADHPAGKDEHPYTSIDGMTSPKELPTDGRDQPTPINIRAGVPQLD